MSRRLSLVPIALVFAALLPPSAGANPGDFYVGNPGGGNIVRINHHNAHQSVVASGGPLSSPDSGDFTSSGSLVIADYSASAGDGAVFKVDTQTGNVMPLASGSPFQGPTDAAIGPGGVIYAADPFAGTNAQGAIFEVAMGTATVVSDDQFFSGGPLGLAFTPRGKLFAPDLDAGPGDSGALIHVALPGGHQTVTARDHHLEEPFGMTLSKSGKFAFLADFDRDSIVRVRISSGAQRVVAHGRPLQSPTDVAMGLDGKLYAVNNVSSSTETPKIIRINPKSGRTHVFAKGGELSSPEGITVQPRG